MGLKSFGLRHALLMSAAALGVGAVQAIAPPAYAQEAMRSYDIPAQDLDDALREFGRQTGRDVLFTPDTVAGKRSQAVRGQFSEHDALQRLIDGSGLRFSQTPSGGYAVQDPNSPTRLGDASGAASSDDAATAEILVIGRRTLNADIRRSEDDPQPYVVFGSDQIEQSSAATVEEFLRTRLPMNTEQGTAAQSSGAIFGTNNRSQFDLRGLGSNQTLVLVDGRRLPGTYGSTFTGDIVFNQPDLNGIPVAAIDRIEVLPATASGIYGGSATGGVINVILKRDYSGVQLQTTYGNTFDSDAASRRIDLSGGASLEDARTHINFALSHSDSNDLLVGDRPFARRGLALQMANNPGAVLGSFSPPRGSTTNICAGMELFPGFSLCTGDPLVLDDSTPLGASFTYVPAGYSGAASDAGAALLTNAGSYNLGLPNDLGGARQALTSAPTIDSASLGIRRDFGANIELFADIGWSRNQVDSPAAAGDQINSVFIPAAAPNNPFANDIVVTFPTPNLSFEHSAEEEAWRGTLGGIWRLAENWSLNLDYVWSQARSRASSTSRIFNPAAAGAFADGALDVIRDVNVFPVNYSGYLFSSPNHFEGPTDTALRDLSLRVSGPLFELPGGPLTFTALLERREERADGSFTDQISPFTLTPEVIFVPGRSQSVDSAYMEARLPLISSNNRPAWADRLEVQASLRYDSYETHSPGSQVAFLTSRSDPLPAFVSTTNAVNDVAYTIGALYAPMEGVSIRGSYATGFLPPSIGHAIGPDHQRRKCRSRSGRVYEHFCWPCSFARYYPRISILNRLHTN